MPVYTAKAGGFFFIVFGVIAAIAALVSLNPIWMYGPYDPSPVTAGSQPDWYMGFADGALRLVPGFLEFTAWGFTFSLNVFIPAILLIPVLYGLAGAYPFLEAWVTGDKREHHLLDRPRNAPTRTGLGVMALVFYFILFFAAGNDMIAIKLGLSINDITNMLRLRVFVGAAAVVLVTRAHLPGLQRRDRELVLHGRETGRIVRTAEGKYFEVHEPRRARALGLVQHDTPKPLELQASVDSNGVRRSGTPMERLRAKVSSFYFSNRVHAVTPAELAAAHYDGTTHEALPTRHRSGTATARRCRRAPVTDAYAPHETSRHRGCSREMDPEAETTSTR